MPTHHAHSNLWSHEQDSSCSRLLSASCLLQLGIVRKPFFALDSMSKKRADKQAPLLENGWQAALHDHRACIPFLADLETLKARGQLCGVT